MRTYVHRFAVVTSLAAGILVAHSREARATDKEACMAAAESVQTLRKSGHLHDAQKAIATCSRSDCPSFVRHDCDAWAADLARDQPSILVHAHTMNGEPIRAVHVLVDGAPPTDSAVDARGISILLDPGSHTLHVEHAPDAPFDASFTLTLGEREHLIDALLAPAIKSAPVKLPETLEPPPVDSSPAPPVAPAQSTRPVPEATYVFGAIGAASLASFAVFGLAGSFKYSSLETSCRVKACGSSDVSGVRTEFLVANLSLALAAVSVGAATVVYVTRPAVGSVAVGGGVVPVAGGAVASGFVRF